MFPISRSEEIPRKLSAKKREINSPESRLIACLSRPSFYFFSTFHRAKKTRMPRASPRAYTRGHSWGQSRLRSSPPFHGGEKKKEGDIRGTREGGAARGDARGSRRDEETGSTKRARKRVPLRSPIPAGRKRPRCSVLRWSPSGQVAASLSLLGSTRRSSRSSRLTERTLNRI